MNRPLCKQCKNIIPWSKRGKDSPFRISIGNYLAKQFCNNKCRGIYQSIYKIGKDNPNFRGGKSECLDCEKELSYRYSWKKNPRCRPCYYKFAKRENHPNWKGGNPTCTQCRGKVGDWYSKLCRKCYRGKNHPQWKGGISKLSALIRKLPQYRKWYMSVFRRDKFTCQECGKRGGLSAHHIKSFGDILKDNKIDSLQKAIRCKELWIVKNGITLCVPCHKLTPNFGRRLH
ncbi:MAG TPA: hypothetical protein ENI23_11770 [bacterium]|nr:hypothetical protein [bacterium]